MSLYKVSTAQTQAKFIRNFIRGRESLFELVWAIRRLGGNGTLAVMSINSKSSSHVSVVSQRAM